jgi:hypothetical protein
MPKAITEREVQLIVEMIRHWPKGEPFKWETICKGSKSIIGYEPSRQALNKKPALVNAYDVKKKLLRAEANKLNKVTRPRSTLEAMERIAKLQEDNDQLKAEVQKMAEIANLFITNASIKGFTRGQLMKPLPGKK